MDPGLKLQTSASAIQTTQANESVELTSTHNPIHEKEELSPLPGTKKVGVSASVSAVRDIDCATSSFWCKLWINILYEDPAVANREGVFRDDEFASFDESESSKLSKFTAPNPTLINSIDVDRAEESLRIVDASAGLVTWNIRLQGTFSFTANVRDFPFDAQALSVRIAFKHTFSLVTPDQLIQDKSRKIPRPKYSETSWWGVYNNIEWEPLHFMTAEAKESDTECGKPRPPPVVTAVFRKAKHGIHDRHEFKCWFSVVRKPDYYVWNVISFVAVLLVLNVATIVTPPEDIADRMGLNLGLILTFAAFKITVAGDTPRVGYLTVLDKFLMIGFGLTAVLGVEAIIVYMLISTDTKLDGVGGGTPHGLARAVDNAVGMLYAVAVISANGLFMQARQDEQKRRSKIEDEMNSCREFDDDDTQNSSNESSSSSNSPRSPDALADFEATRTTNAAA